jgi:hypothetical protein
LGINLKFVTISIALVILFTSFAYSLQISLRPVDVTVNNLAKGGYYEVDYLISVGSIDETVVEYVLDNSTIYNWISFEPDNGKLFVSKDNPQELKMVIRPPLEAPNGRYEGRLRFSLRTSEVASGSTSLVVYPGLVSKINLSVIGSQITDCRVTGVDIADIEQYDDVILTVNVYNNGNIDIVPNVTYDIKNSDSVDLLSGYYSDYLVKPSRRETVSAIIPNRLDVGQYLIDVNVPNCDDFSKLLSFDVLRPGELSKDLKFISLLSENVWNFMGDKIILRMEVKNVGESNIAQAYFKGYIELDGTFIQEVETTPLKVLKGEEQTFEYIFSPSAPGRYYIKGNIYYDGKKSFERSNPINVNPRETSVPTEDVGLMENAVFDIIIIGLIILIIILLIKKKK